MGLSCLLRDKGDKIQRQPFQFAYHPPLQPITDRCFCVFFFLCSRSRADNPDCASTFALTHTLFLHALSNHSLPPFTLTNYTNYPTLNLMSLKRYKIALDGWLTCYFYVSIIKRRLPISSSDCVGDQQNTRRLRVANKIYVWDNSTEKARDPYRAKSPTHCFYTSVQILTVFFSSESPIVPSGHVNLGQNIYETK